MNFKGVFNKFLFKKVANKIRSDIDPLVGECLAQMVNERAQR